MKAKEIKNKQEDELKKLLLEKQKALRLFRFGVAGSKAKNVKEGRNLRKDIARILTETSSRRIPR
ncbi:MAG: 50S ribosomal protein L29 [Parcubacteria group bacterium]|nr:50S ribosomal protein L29 [Parcubacteria group bacterium]MBI2049082.1 50S ribosomal protein L29 [Parcubacteria group bacterium]